MTKPSSLHYWQKIEIQLIFCEPANSNIAGLNRQVIWRRDTIMLTQLQKQEFYRNGFIKVADVIPRQMVDATRQSINHSI